MKRLVLVFVVVIAALVMAACSKEQETIKARNEVLGEREVDSNFAEAQQIMAIELWKDNPDKIVNLYIINPVSGGLLIPPVQCMGVPVSSTESLEPNNGSPAGADSGDYWKVKADGIDILTNELAGRDGTFGDPVPFRQCMTVEGHYIDFPSLGLPYLVTSQSYTFAPSTVQRDFESEARLIAAEEIIKRGGCVNYETLVEVPCEGGQ